MYIFGNSFQRRGWIYFSNKIKYFPVTQEQFLKFLLILLKDWWSLSPALRCRQKLGSKTATSYWDPKSCWDRGGKIWINQQGPPSSAAQKSQVPRAASLCPGRAHLLAHEPHLRKLADAVGLSRLTLLRCLNPKGPWYGWQLPVRLYITWWMLTCPVWRHKSKRQTWKSSWHWHSGTWTATWYLQILLGERGDVILRHAKLILNKISTSTADVASTRSTQQVTGNTSTQRNVFIAKSTSVHF